MIIIIDNYDSFTFNLYQAIALYHANIKIIRNDKISIADLKKLNPLAIVLSPGPGRPEDAGICIDIIKMLGNTVPLLGVCLGHQAIITAFGGKVIQAPEIIHGKPDDIYHNQTGLYKDLPNPFSAGRYHSLIGEVNSLPETLAITAKNKNGMIMGIQHTHYPIHGVQFHPESILTPVGNTLIKNFIINIER